MPGRARAEADRQIADHLAVLSRRLGAAAVLGYVALRDEARIDAFLAASLEAGRSVYLPTSDGEGVRFFRWTPSQPLRRDRHGVPAPIPAADGGVLPPEPALIVVPGRAFDRGGARLGRGGGLYDRVLGAREADSIRVGAAYLCQLVDEVPMEAHDLRVDWIVTEAGAFRCDGGNRK